MDADFFCLLTQIAFELAISFFPVFYCERVEISTSTDGRIRPVPSCALGLGYRYYPTKYGIFKLTKTVTCYFDIAFK